jgi:hypothetical protein
MNAHVIDLTTREADVAQLMQRARAGDTGAAAALLDDIAVDVYDQVLLTVADPRAAQRITDDALIAVTKPLRRGEIGSVRELRWRVASHARTEAAVVADRREQLTGVRTSIRHLFGLLSVSGLAVYATVLAI